MSNASTFKAAYEKLRANAERLSDNNEIDIDELVPLVTESTKAYAICKERLDAVEKALQEAFKESGSSPVIGALSSTKEVPLPITEAGEEGALQ
jgi:exodeoxyribonuclease VII small subunit